MSTTTSPTATSTHSQRRRRLRWIGYGLLGVLAVLVLMVIVYLIAWSRGLIQFPALTGPYHVGKVEYHLVDESRPEIFSAAPDDKRELMITIYYPASPPADASPAPYISGPIRAEFGTPDFFQDSVRAHSFVNVPLADDGMRYPVIIFSPGMGFLPIKYAPTLEDLASHGYIVVSYHIRTALPQQFFPMAASWPPPPKQAAAPCQKPQRKPPATPSSIQLSIASAQSGSPMCVSCSIKWNSSM